MEQTVKKRPWVKNAAIIFLAIMLVLTFFSNTIMNRSLPEVVTVYVEENSIDTKVRISGTVSAKENYDVVLEQSRKVATVPVRVGQEVNVGDVLFTLEPGDSAELEAARDELHALELSYQRALLSADSNNYDREKRDIELAEAAVERAQTRYDNYALTLSQLAELEKDITAAQKSLDEATVGVSNSSASSGGSGGGASSGQYETLEQAKAAVTLAKNNLSAAKLAYSGKYAELETLAKLQIAEDYDIENGSGSFNALSEAQKKVQFDTSLPYYMEEAADALSATDVKRIAYEKISAAQEAYDAALAAQKAAQNSIDDADSYDDYVPGKSYNGKSHSYWLEQQSKAQTKLEQLKTQKEQYESAYAELTGAEDNLRSLQDALEDAQKNDKLTALDNQEILYNINKAKARIEELSGDGQVQEIKAKASGILQNLSVSAGHTANAGDVLATIQVTDLGYTMTASVTNDQARLLHVGDTASVSNYYWGASTTAEITAIRPDPKNPQSGKLVMFDVTGNVTADSKLDFSIGEKNATYDLVVPNSAIRSDTNGSFVLIITAKNSPLGNRYYATRVDVEILASDDHFTAVSGTLEAYDSVITTATANAPIKNGDMVRLADNNA